jgi:hypothetical protein
VTPAQEAVAQLDALSWNDPETAHGRADEILCEFIRAIGHAEVAVAFEAAADRVGFWYA